MTKTTQIFNIYLYSTVGILFVLKLNNNVNGFEEEEGCVARRLRNISNCLKLESFQPWPEDDECKIYEVKIFPENTFQPTAVVTFPASGQPWLLRMIERSTGVVAGKVIAQFKQFDPESQIRCGVKPGDGRTMVQGTLDVLYRMLPSWHKKLLSYDDEDLCWPTLSRMLFNYRGILLIRNPWQAIIIARERIRDNVRKCSSCTKLHPKISETFDFEHKNLKKYFEFGAEQWVSHMKSWVKGSPHGSGLVIIKYENLIKNPEIELRRALKYLNVTIQEGRLNCVLKDPVIIHEGLYENSRRAIVSDFFEKNMDLKASNILINGIVEINKILHLKGVSTHLDYKRPTNSEFLTRNDMFTIRIS